MDTEGKWLAALGGRKFILAVLAIVLVTFAVQVSGDVKLEFIKWIVGIFAGANVLQKSALTALGARRQ